jgi:hypothetical protein
MEQIFTYLESLKCVALSYTKAFAKYGEPKNLFEVNFDILQKYVFSLTYIFSTKVFLSFKIKQLYIYIYIYIYSMCVCVCFEHGF